MSAPSFDSRNDKFKIPFGAVACGTVLKFNIQLNHNDIKGENADFIIEKDGCEPKRLKMQFINCKDGFDLFSCEYIPESTGLYFYWFEVFACDGIKYIFNDGHGKGNLSSEKGAPFQQTVFDPSFKTPEWVKGGVMYQIFPDRFCRKGNPPDTNLPSNRIILHEWGNFPPQSEEGGYCSNYYFGGNFQGIISKLPYLKSLGVTAIYMNPIFEAHSYHRYNTADYTKVDPLLGTDEDFKKLCSEAAKLGMRIILDGVFSHTGEDSIYFNKYQRYPDKGAYESRNSKYFKWYDFEKWPDEYRCWWGFKELPEVNELEPTYLDFITGKNGIIKHWLNLGASGWRLDVTDELPDLMLENIRSCAKKAGNDNYIIGEVWEDASNKISYGERRHYLEGKQLDSVMNYPWRNAVINYLKTGEANIIAESVMTIIENYPKESLDTLMNLLGSHDTIRIITCLAGESAVGKSISWKQYERMTPERRKNGLRLVRLASAIEYMLPGVPCIYYGDEAGAEGYEDPFNRMCYDWGNEDNALIDWYKKLGSMRAACSALKKGDFHLIAANGAIFAFERYDEKNRISIAVNAGDDDEKINVCGKIYLICGGASLENGILNLPAKSCAIWGNGNWTETY